MPALRVVSCNMARKRLAPPTNWKSVTLKTRQVVEKRIAYEIEPCSRMRELAKGAEPKTMLG